MSPAGPAAWHQHRPLVLPALALWGWQTEMLAIALLMAALLELPRLVPARLEIRQTDFDRLWSFTSVLFLAVIFYLALARQGLDAVGALTGAPPAADAPDGMRRVSSTALTFLRWLPFVLFPFVCAVSWSRATVLPWSTFSLYEQARAKRQPHVPPPEWALQPMHPGYLYIGVTLFAASTIATHNDLFLPLLLVTLVLALWPWRNRRWGVLAWCILLTVLGTVAVVGNQGHRAARAAWAAMEERLLHAGGTGDGTVGNPNQTSRTTSLGAIGSIKQSGAIILRITSSDGAAPGLLREASFNRFRVATWDNGHRTFEGVEPQPPAADAPTLTITRASFNGESPLAIPGDLAGLKLPGTGLLEAGGLGSLRIRGGLPLVIYTAARGGGGHQLDEAPEPDDLNLALLSAEERTALAQIADDLAITGTSADVAATRLERWFGSAFSYSLYQARRADGQSPLLRFLQETKAGHCEYFATATVLLLRAAGIPARYAVGFSVSERDGERWLGRGRDAHAWTLVWNGRRWNDLDPTPATWHDVEAAAKPWGEHLRDLWAEGWHRFDLWRQEGGRWQIMVFIAGMMVLGWIGWRQLRGSAWRRARNRAAAADEPTNQGLDSEFLALFENLARRHGPRGEAETPRTWLLRLGLLGSDPVGQRCATALDLHQRLRFDPAGLTRPDRLLLRETVATLQTELERTPATVRKSG